MQTLRPIPMQYKEFNLDISWKGFFLCLTKRYVKYLSLLGRTTFILQIIFTGNEVSKLVLQAKCIIS